jgi:hypothetical protein
MTTKNPDDIYLWVLSLLILNCSSLGWANYISHNKRGREKHQAKYKEPEEAMAFTGSYSGWPECDGYPYCQTY